MRIQDHQSLWANLYVSFGIVGEKDKKSNDMKVLIQFYPPFRLTRGANLTFIMQP